VSTVKVKVTINVKVKVEDVPVNARKAHGWSSGITPLILNFGTIVRFTPQPFHPGTQ
jgi:hypothetical protein